MIIAVDFDGTIVEHKFPEVGEEIPSAIRVLKKLQQEGNIIIIWTCRCYPYLTPAIEWMDERGFRPDYINSNAHGTPGFATPKIYADIYIDDRNLGGFPGWDIVDQELGKGEEMIGETKNEGEGR